MDLASRDSTINEGAIVLLSQSKRNTSFCLLKIVSFVTCSVEDNPQRFVVDRKIPLESLLTVDTPTDDLNFPCKPAAGKRTVQERNKGEIYDRITTCFYYVNKLPMEKGLSTFSIERVSHEVFPLDGRVRENNDVYSYFLDSNTAFFLGNRKRRFDKVVSVFQREEDFNKDIAAILRRCDR